MMDEVFRFVATFKEFPPRSFPPSFNPANIMESTLDGFKEDKRLREGLDLDRIRAGLNRMIEQQLQDREDNGPEQTPARMRAGRCGFPVGRRKFRLASWLFRTHLESGRAAVRPQQQEN